MPQPRTNSAASVANGKRRMRWGLTCPCLSMAMPRRPTSSSTQKMALPLLISSGCIWPTGCMMLVCSLPNCGITSPGVSTKPMPQSRSSAASCGLTAKIFQTLKRDSGRSVTVIASIWLLANCASHVIPGCHGNIESGWRMRHVDVYNSELPNQRLVRPAD